MGQPPGEESFRYEDVVNGVCVWGGGGGSPQRKVFSQEEVPSREGGGGGERNKGNTSNFECCQGMCGTEFL